MILFNSIHESVGFKLVTRTADLVLILVLMLASLAGLPSRVTALPYPNYKTKSE